MFFCLISEVCYSQNTENKEMLKQYPVPSAFKEIPFIENNPEPGLSETEKARGYMVFSRPITDVVYPNTKPLQSERIDSLYGFGTLGEFEPLNLSVYPVRDIRRMQVSVSDLKHANNSSVIPAMNIETRLLTYWNIRYPYYNQTCTTYRRVPELLEKVSFNSFPTKESQRYWFTVKVPENCIAGDYKGTVKLKDELGELLIPVTFRVFAFKLLKDPRKHFSAYTSVDLYKKYSVAKSPEEKEFWEKAAMLEFSKMRDYGFDTAPTIRLEYDEKNDCLFFPGEGREIDMISKADINRLVPVLMDHAVRSLYMKHTGVSDFKKWKVPVMPDEKFYSHLSELVRKFEEKRKSNNWPEFVYSPADEIDTQSAEFGAKACKAVKNAGCRTFITKDPELRVYEYKTYEKYVDMWCSQPFSVPCEKIAAAKKEYWCYPNPIAGEIRRPEVMSRAGRMTYGFGLWKSGYSMLMPWAWRANLKPFFDFDYLRKDRSSPCGNKIAENGEFVPAVYWDCFREGYDDGRYIYTLQLFIAQRENSSVKECRLKVEEGKKLLKEIWNSFNAEKIYDDKNSFTSSDFITLRWQMASLIEALLKYPAVNNTSKTDSVLSSSLEHSAKEKSVSVLNSDISEGYNLTGIGDNSKWTSPIKEGSVSRVSEKEFGREIMLFNVAVDYAHDGEFENGKYPVGWPRCSWKFDSPKDFSGHDGLFFRVKFYSNRDEVADDYTYLFLEGKNLKNERVFGSEMLGEYPENKWIPVSIPFTDVKSAKLKEISSLNMIVPESYYPDKTDISFLIDGPYLYSFKDAFLTAVRHPHFIRKSGNTEIPVEIEANGISQSRCLQLDLQINDDEGKTVHSEKFSMSTLDMKYYLPLTGLKPGKYILKLFQRDILKYSSEFNVYQ